MERKWYIISLALMMLMGTSCNHNDINHDGYISNTVFTGNDASDFVGNETWSSVISIVWNGTEVSVSGAAEGVSITHTNGYVTVSSSARSIAYAVSGNGTGQLNIYSKEKFKLSMEGLTLSCPNGPVINDQCPLTCYAVLVGTNVLSDGSPYSPSSENRKAAFFSEGPICFSGAGSLSITGNFRHALASDEYIRLCSGTGIIDLTAKSDGLHTNDGVVINDGTLTIHATDEGIQSELSSVYISGGKVTIISQTEGIEAKGAMQISGGEVYTQAKDDAINSGRDLTIVGGVVMAYSTNNDGIDANGNCYINGGIVYAIGSREPETAIDVNSEQRKQLYFQSGTLVAIGGLESGANLTQACYATSSVSKNTWYALYRDWNVAFVFNTPSDFSSSVMVVSTSGETSLLSGVTTSDGSSILNGYALMNTTVSGGSSVTLSAYTPSSGGGPGGGGPGGGPGGDGPGGH